MKRAAASIAFACVVAAACGRGTPAPTHRMAPDALKGANVILITIDTLRADYVGAYGSTRGLTPTLDRLAREGVVFRTAYAHAPLTLPSHASIMTGTYPTTNGVHDNGSYRLRPDAKTLAAALKSAGYRTGAFVGAFVLDARFGLNNGFDFYDDRMLGTGGDLEVVQRPAEPVLAAASGWITDAPAPNPHPTHPTHPAPSTQHPTPFFCWVHLYDPHEPYSPPEPYATRYAADPYSGEIAYVDASIGAFLERLRGAGTLDRTLLVVAADHGESLGDHGERTHGLFAYNSTLRVPLIFWAGSALPAQTIASAARLVDVTPTILDLAGVPAPSPLDGSSLRAVLQGSSDDRASYFEALNANETRDWAPLRGIVSGGLKLIDLPIPELYDQSADPEEARNLYASARDRARPLESQLDRIVSANPAAASAAPVDPDAAARLRSLGYVVGARPKTKRTYTAADDPKRLVHLNAALDAAAAMWARGRADEAIATLRQTIAERADLLPAYERLAFMLGATGRSADAVALLDQAARNGHADRSLLRALGNALRDAGDVRRSASVLEAVLKQDDSDLQTLDALAQTYTRLGRGGEAEALFKRVIERSPNAAATWTNLGVLYVYERRDRDAQAALMEALRVDPAQAGAHNVLGVVFARQGDEAAAASHWREALRLRPDFTDARENLARIEKR